MSLETKRPSVLHSVVVLTRKGAPAASAMKSEKGSSAQPCVAIKADDAGTIHQLRTK